MNAAFAVELCFYFLLFITDYRFDACFFFFTSLFNTEDTNNHKIRIQWNWIVKQNSYSNTITPKTECKSWIFKQPNKRKSTNDMHTKFGITNEWVFCSHWEIHIFFLFSIQHSVVRCVFQLIKTRASNFSFSLPSLVAAIAYSRTWK